MNKDTLRSSHPSLFPLRMVLFTAELDTPAQPPLRPHDLDEALALTLIEKIRYPKAEAFMDMRIEPQQPFQPGTFPAELARVYA